MTITERLSKSFVEKRYRDLPARVVEKAKSHILDTIGSAFPAVRTESARIVYDTFLERDGGSKATIIGFGDRTSATSAALINGVLSHTVEFDDIGIGGHPGCVNVPAALAIAEREGASGRDFLVAVILGYEVQGRVSLAVMPSHYRYWHTTSTCGSFGAAAAAGKLVQLNVEEMTHALGIAGTLAFGLIETFGSMTKPLHAGRAAQNGVTGALLARRGFTGSKTILEGSRGFFRATSDNPRPEKATEDLGKVSKILEASIKPYPCCGHVQAPLYATLQILEEHEIDPGDIREVEIGTYKTAVELVGARYEPKSIQEAQFSTPYIQAVCILDGMVNLTQFTEERLREKKVLKLARKVNVMVNPEFNAAGEGARVTIRTRMGDYTKIVKTRKGTRGDPLTRKELLRKFEANTGPVLRDKGRVRRIIETIDNLESVSDISELSSMLKP